MFFITPKGVLPITLFILYCSSSHATSVVLSHWKFFFKSINFSIVLAYLYNHIPIYGDDAHPPGSLYTFYFRYSLKFSLTSASSNNIIAPSLLCIANISFFLSPVINFTSSRVSQPHCPSSTCSDSYSLYSS